MTIKIHPNDRILDIQKAFSAVYPHLKLQFFSKPHQENKGSFAKFLIHDPQTKVIELNPSIMAGSIGINPGTQTWSLEKNFEKLFKLHAQVFRKSGTIWLETSVSDYLSLGEQEKKGAEPELEAEAGQEWQEIYDYHEQD